MGQDVALFGRAWLFGQDVVVWEGLVILVKVFRLIEVYSKNIISDTLFFDESNGNTIWVDAK